SVPTNHAAKLRSGVVVGTGAVTLDIDIPATAVSGTITVNGAAAGTGAGAGAGLISLRNAAGDTAQLGATSARTYSALVVPGTYDVYYGFTTRGTAVPSNAAFKVRSGVVVGSGSLALDVDIPAGTVSGAITINGAAAASGGIGAVTLRNAAG